MYIPRDTVDAPTGRTEVKPVVAERDVRSMAQAPAKQRILVRRAKRWERRSVR